jgi:hypothetical protein
MTTSIDSIAIRIPRSNSRFSARIAALPILNLLMSSLLATVACGQTSYQWTNFVGQPGFSQHQNGTGTSAHFGFPTGVAVDGSGNLYVVDQGFHTIRKVTAGGTTTTLAGNAGSFGAPGNGNGSAVRFFSPFGVAVDGAGNVYVGDQTNAAIRKISPSGSVMTLAGMAGVHGSSDGTGTSAKFSLPTGVAVDGSGNVYVADTNNHTIRKVSAAGVVTTYAGRAGEAEHIDGSLTNARFRLPRGVAVDSGGNVFVADTGNHVIRKISPSGVVSTLAGGTVWNYGNDDGTGRLARFMEPQGVAVDGSGNVFVADSGNGSIRRVTASGVVTTIGGGDRFGNRDGIGSVAQFTNTLYGVAVGPGGVLYVADGANCRISRGVPVSAPISPPTVTTTSVGSVTANSTNSGGNVTASGGASVIERGVVYATFPNPTITNGNKVVSGSGTGVFSTLLTGLDSGTTYYARAYATNSAGTSYGAQISFTTPTSGALSVSPVSQSVSASAVSLSFTVIASGSWSWSKSGAASWVTIGEPSTQSGNQTFSYTVATNTGTSSRSATIVFVSGSLSASHTITQAGSGGSQPGNDLATAIPTAQNSSTSASIDAGGETDYYRIDLPSAGTLDVRTTGSTDTYGSLLNANGIDLASNDDSDGGRNFRITRIVTPGTYYVRVRHYNEISGTGVYELVVAFNPSVPLSARPDVAVGKSLSRMRGNGIFGIRTGQQIDLTLRGSESRSAVITVANRGAGFGRMRMLGTPPNRQLRIRYLAPSGNITAAMTGRGYFTQEMLPFSNPETLRVTLRLHTKGRKLSAGKATDHLWIRANSVRDSSLGDQGWIYTKMP